jgi:hypothetical protein
MLSYIHRIAGHEGPKQFLPVLGGATLVEPTLQLEELRVLDQLVPFELIEDPCLLAELSARYRSIGHMLVCDRCGDEEELIAAVLVLLGSGKVWPLCGLCLRQMPSVCYVS